MSDRRPLLRVVTAAYPSPSQPRRARFIEELHEALLAEFDTEILAPRVFPDDPLREDRGGIRVHRFDYGARGHTLRESGAGGWRKARFWWAMHRHAKRVWPGGGETNAQPGLFVGHWILPSGPVVQRAGKRCGWPWVLYGHGTDLHTVASQRLWGGWTGRLVRAASQTVVVSRDLARRAAHRAGPHARRDVRSFPVVPMGVSSTFFDQASSQAEPESSNCGDRAFEAFELGPDRPLRLLYVGDFIPQKGVDVLATVLGRLAQQGVPVALDALGGGPLEARLRRLNLGVVESAAPERVARAMQEADLLVLPTRAEGTPLVVQEAIVMGCPVLAPPVGGIPDLFRNRSGWIPLRTTGHGVSERSLERTLIEWQARRDELMTLRRIMIQQEVQSLTWSERMKGLVEPWKKLAVEGAAFAR